MPEAKITRSNAVLAAGILFVLMGICSFYGGMASEEAEKKQRKRDGTSQPEQAKKPIYCEGLSPMTVTMKSYIAPTIEPDCWTPAVNTESGKGTIQTEARNNESYIAYCANGNQYDGQGLITWTKAKGCTFPVYFKAADAPFQLYIKQE
jgi:hypothetical protein